MFNRRHLRIKALQGVFNYFQKEKVAFTLGMEELEERFSPDLNSMEVQDHSLLKQQKKEAEKLFKSEYRKKEVNSNAEEEITKAVIGAKVIYSNYLNQEGQTIEKQLLEDTQNVWHNYISTLKFLEELAKHIQFLYENNDNKRVKQELNKNDYKFGWSSFFDQLREIDEYVSYTHKHQFKWQEDDLIIKNFYRKTLLESEKYKEYLKAESSLESDCLLLIALGRKLLFKDGAVKEFYEEQDPFWDENQEIVSGLLVKTFKKLKNQGELELIRLSPNWEEDKDFLISTYKKGLKFPEELSLRIQDKLANWELDRLANVDRHILELAITEMIEFPSIPVKVTINEFLEISKKYSAPKSKVFINGLLDVISKELIEEKVIKKSGRGLIDNK